MSNLQSLEKRTIDYLLDHGWQAATRVDHYNSFTQRSHDLFGIIDVLAVGPEGTCGVQVTSASNVSTRVRKMSESEHIGALREAGWLLLVHGWRKNKSGRYELHRVVDVS